MNRLQRIVCFYVEHHIVIPASLSIAARDITPYNKDEDRLAQDLFVGIMMAIPSPCAPAVRTEPASEEWLRERLPHTGQSGCEPFSGI